MTASTFLLKIFGFAILSLAIVVGGIILGAFAFYEVVNFTGWIG